MAADSYSTGGLKKRCLDNIPTEEHTKQSTLIKAGTYCCNSSNYHWWM